MWQYNYNIEKELYHHGIKGQKWGVRRFQNPDGTLTAAGKKRKATAEALITQNIKGGKDKPPVSPLEKITKNTGDVARSASNIVNTASKMKNKGKINEDIKNMSDVELKKRIERMNLEKQYASLRNETINAGSNKVSDILSIVGETVTIGSSIVGTAAIIYGLTHK